MSDELLPCPFCGAGASKYKQDVFMFWVACDACGVSVLPRATPEEAIKIWNTRHESGELPEWLKTTIKNKIDNIREDSCGESGSLKLAEDYKISGLTWVLLQHPPKEVPE